MQSDRKRLVEESVDRRQESRIPVQRPCRVMRSLEPLTEVPAVTSNVSRSGMLVQFGELNVPGFLPKVGDFARILIDLPADAGFPPRALECSARVVRTDGSETGRPVAAFEIHGMRIRERRQGGRRKGRPGEDLLQ